MDWLSSHLLTVVTFLPLFGALGLLFVRRQRTHGDGLLRIGKDGMAIGSECS